MEPIVLLRYGDDGMYFLEYVPEIHFITPIYSNAFGCVCLLFTCNLS